MSRYYKHHPHMSQQKVYTEPKRTRRARWKTTPEQAKALSLKACSSEGL